jgi:hypothetical protein
MLVATGTVTVDMTKSKLMTLPKFVSDGSSRQTTFNDGSWGGPSRYYVVSAKNLKKKSIDEIIKRAKAFSRTARQTGTKVPTGIGNFIANDYRANLVDESASEEENDDNNCKLPTLKYYYLTNYFYYRIHFFASSYWIQLHLTVCHSP